MKRILTFLSLLGLFAKCHTDPIKPTSITTVVTKPVGCDFSNDRPEIVARLISAGTLSQARVGMAVAAAGTKILFAGATSSQNSIGYSTVDMYDLATQTWATAQLSKARSHIAAVAAGNKVFFAGGRLRERDYADEPFTTVDIYDVTTNTWSVASLSEPRAFIGTAAVGNKVFFAGGEGKKLTRSDDGVWESNPSNRVDMYDLSSGTWSTATLGEGRRAYISAVTADNKVYFAGGQEYDSPYPSRTIDIYDNGTSTWSTSRLLEPKTLSSGIAVGDNIYWAGGWNDGVTNEPSCSVEIRNIHSQVSRLDRLSKPASWVIADGQNAVVKDNKILYFRHNIGDERDFRHYYGYADFRHHTSDASRFDIYDTVRKSWSIGVLPESINGASIISVNNTVYIAGGVASGKLSNQVWKLEF